MSKETSNAFLRDMKKPRRKDIKGIMYGFSSSFLSRNNDIDGYWGIGKLYKHAIFRQTHTVTIDVLSGEIYPPEKSLMPFLKVYTEYIFTRFRGRNLPLDWLKSVTIIIGFDQLSVAGDKRSKREGTRFTCEIIFIDDLGQNRSCVSHGRCREHNPRFEHRSLRAS